MDCRYPIDTYKFSKMINLKNYIVSKNYKLGALFTEIEILSHDNTNFILQILQDLQV